MSKEKDRNLNIGNAKIMFRNFAGKPDNYNKTGAKTFCVVIDDESAKVLKKDGWNVKMTKPKSEDYEPVPYIQVTLSYRFKDGRAPKVISITSGGAQPLIEDTVGMLDWAEIANIDLVINPSYWSVDGKSGIKAYLKSAYVTIQEDPFEAKYRNILDEGDDEDDIF